MLTYAILSQNGGTLGYKYLCRMKDHYSPLEYVELFLVIICICVTNHVRFCSLDDIWKKWSQAIFPQNGARLGYKYLFRMKDRYSPLEGVELFLVIICICVTNHILFLLTGRYFVKNAYICKFFSKWPNAGV